MHVLLYNAVAFVAAVALYGGLLLVVGQLGELLGVAPLRSMLSLTVAFGVAGHFLFRGKSREVLVLLALLAWGVGAELYSPAQSRPLVQFLVWAGLGVLAALATRLAGWVAGFVRVLHGKASSPADEAATRERRRTTLAYRVGKWVGDRRRKPDRSE